MSAKEIWRIVPSIPGLLASSEGRLMVVPYVATLPNGGQRNYGGEPTYGQWDGSRFLYQFRGKTHKAHRLICEAFNGAPLRGEVCMHLDENARNNKPSNLSLGSQKENLNAPGFLSYCRGRTGERNPLLKGRAKRVALSVKTT